MQLQKRINDNTPFYTLLIQNEYELDDYTHVQEELSHHFIIDIWDIMIECSTNGIVDNEKFIELFSIRKPKIPMLAKLIVYTLDKKPSVKIRGGVIEFIDLANTIHNIRNMKYNTILKSINDNKHVVINVSTGGFYSVDTDGNENDPSLVDYIDINQLNRFKILTTVLGTSCDLDTSFNFESINFGLDINKRVLILENSNKVGIDGDITSVFNTIDSDMLENEVQVITNLETRLKYYSSRDIYKKFHTAIKNGVLDTIYFSTLTIETEQFEFLFNILNEIMVDLSDKKLYICAIISEGKKLSENIYNSNIIITEEVTGIKKIN